MSTERERSRAAESQEQVLLDEDGLIERRHNIVSLRQASLSWANLRGASLYTAALSGAKGGGATMPDGQTLKSAANPDGPTFEEWLKSQSRNEDGQNE